jgi:hypothetical protein
MYIRPKTHSPFLHVCPLFESCRGRRKHLSCLKQILGSSTDRHNDVFGLTIFQFEREFKACLKRRKQNEPHILNIVFPIKTDKRYLEYLKNIQSQQTDKSNIIRYQSRDSILI